MCVIHFPVCTSCQFPVHHKAEKAIKNQLGGGGRIFAPHCIKSRNTVPTCSLSNKRANMMYNICNVFKNELLYTDGLMLFGKEATVELDKGLS